MRGSTLVFFSNTRGVGTTSLVYHIAWMLSSLDQTVLVVDLDPQAKLTAAFLDEDNLVQLWTGLPVAPATIHRCVVPLITGRNVREPILRQKSANIYLLPGDPALSGVEEFLAREWPNCLGDCPDHAFRATTAFWRVIQMGIQKSRADLALVDVGPGLGAINRAALIAADFVVAPLGADLLSLISLQTMGPALERWRHQWTEMRNRLAPPAFELPGDGMRPIGYLLAEHGWRLTRPLRPDDRWFRRMPGEYAKSVLNRRPAPDLSPETDPNLVAVVKHFRNLSPLSRDARKPIFYLTPADGAVGSHAVAVNAAYTEFRNIAKELLRRMGSIADHRWAPVVTYPVHPGHRRRG